ncbi:hypothetical protein SAMD00024442_3_62 [Candidatus Symbiothrix dinenymphae]|nr:hypothetical protein SAMD00024442_3_62 [Candidatus Symbiothrix dinenymphae]
MKQTLTIFLLCCCLTAAAQIGTWTSHLSYQNPTAMVETPHHIFAIYDGALLSYSTDDEHVETYSLADGLNDVRIKHIAWCAAVKALVIVYENANIDLFFGKNEVVNIAAIKDKTSLLDKTVNSLNVIGKEAYLSTAFGIVAVDVSRKEIKWTCEMGVGVFGVCRPNNDNIYALTDNELIKYANVNSNLVDREQWGNLNEVFDTLQFNVGKMVAPDARIAGIHVNSPANNTFHYIKYASNKLVAVSGGRGADRFNIYGTLMILENGKWNNPNFWERDLVSAVVDPRDPNHYFVSSWGEGVYEFRDGVCVYIHALNTNALQTANPNYYPEHYVRVDGLTYDRHNNLYMVNSLVQNGLVILTADNRWLTFDYPELSGQQVNHILITKNNLKWFNFFRTETAGICVLNDNNTLENTADDQTYFSGQFIDQQGADVGASTYLCMAEDLNGLVWVGTNNGPISFSSAEQVGRGQCNRVLAMDENELNGYPLLEGESITAIAVDGANRKWMGTHGNGVFLIDQSSGTLKAEQFNTDNSEILSNNITAIAIDDNSGEVYIATEQGLCSYRSDATEGKANYSNIHAFPNPVYPARQSQVSITSMMAQSTVKITDTAGNLIKEGISNGGQFTWNCTDRNGNIVKAGIYLAFATNPDGSDGGVAKIMVIR